MQATVRDDHIRQLKNYKKLMRLHNIVKCQPNEYKESKLDEILELDGDINYQMSDDGDTALHFAMKAAIEGWLKNEKSKKVIPSKMIAAGADPTIANREGQTPVHVAAGDFKNCVQRFMKSPHIRHILQIVHIRNGNTTNFTDNYGLSHFHVACMIDNMEIVEFFLNNGVSVDGAVDMDAPEYPGYTSLLFAVEFGSLDLVDKLLDHGANLMKDSRGMTSLHFLIRRNMEIIQHVSLYHIPTYDCPENGIVINEEVVLAEMELKEKMIRSIVSKRSKTAMVEVDLLPFYVMQTLKDASSNWTQSEIKKCIPMDSICWPGYSALHFAARFDTYTVKLLLEKGADIEVKDGYGVTPFDLCVGRYSIEDIHSIISSHKVWKNILLTDGKTTLLDLVLAMRGPEELTKFLSQIQQSINGISIPRDSPLWPGFSILHLAVTLSKKRMDEDVGRFGPLFGPNDEVQANELIEACLRLGADVLAQDRSGSTPIHLAFRRMDLDAMYHLIKLYDGKSNPTDKDNLSLLHIACVLENENLVKQLLDSSADPNAALSSTFQWDPEVRYFHELISDDEHLHVWPRSTPLHATVAMRNKAIFKLLLEAGANPNARDIHGVTPVHLLMVFYMSYEHIKDYDDLLSRFVPGDCVVDGLSYLHVAAHHAYPKFLEKLVNLGVDVNLIVQTHHRADERLSLLRRRSIDFSARGKRKTKFSHYLSFFAGKTPLHVASHYDYRQGNIPETLVSSGADVLAKKPGGVSPICKILEYDFLLRHYLSVMSVDEEKRLFDKMGLTRLHMACQLRDEQMIRDCLKKGANVNARVRDDSEIWPGFTPLHVVVDSKYNRYDTFKKKALLRRIVRYLLRAGADVMIADAKGRTLLMMKIDKNHVNDILWKELKNSNVNPVSDEGISHFHLACFQNDVNLVKRLLKLGVDPNQTVDYLSDNYPDYTPLHFAVCDQKHNGFFSELPSLRTVDLLIKYGANVDAVNFRKTTPLHIASYPTPGIFAYKRLLRAGADPEAKNVDGKTPSSIRMWYVQNERTRRSRRRRFRFRRRYLLETLASPFTCCNRYFHRSFLYFYELVNLEKK